MLNASTPKALHRRAEDRGHADHGWLQSAHSFSFAGYHDPQWMGFGPLRVINDDRVAGGGGFPMHPHRDFEIFSYVLDGALEHRDSLGNGSVVRKGGVQYMSAGSGVTHSEFNPDPEDPVHFLQIWLIPEVTGTAPSYRTKDLTTEEKDGKLALFISKDGRGDTIKTLADAEVYAATLRGDQTLSFVRQEGRRIYVHIAQGQASVNGDVLKDGDALALIDPDTVIIDQGQDAEILLFDLGA
ncbi:MAG: pirin family protein [Pseudomonadota bacterium]